MRHTFSNKILTHLVHQYRNLCELCGKVSIFYDDIVVTATQDKGEKCEYNRGDKNNKK